MLGLTSHIPVLGLLPIQDPSVYEIDPLVQRVLGHGDNQCSYCGLSILKGVPNTIIGIIYPDPLKKQGLIPLAG
jgi:hypothetical protein